MPRKLIFSFRAVDYRVKKAKIMGRISKPNQEYAEQIFKEAHLHNGLFSQAEAARILNISETQINKLAEKGKLYKVKINENAYIGCSELYAEYLKRIQK